MLKSIGSHLLLAVALFAMPGAYAAGLTVTAVFEGAVPKTLPLDMGLDKACVEHYKDAAPPVNEMLVLGEGQTMANVLVEVVSGLPEGEVYPLPAEAATLTQEGCRYVPRMLALRAGQTLKVKNPDGTLHNVHAQPKINKPFNRGMPAEISEFEVVFDKPEPIFPIRCNVHPWMLAYCAVLDHPYFGVTDASGKVALPDLPAGEYEIRAMHEVLGAKTAKVTVAADASAALTFTFVRPSRQR